MIDVEVAGLLIVQQVVGNCIVCAQTEFQALPWSLLSFPFLKKGHQLASILPHSHAIRN